MVKNDFIWRLPFDFTLIFGARFSALYNATESVHLKALKGQSGKNIHHVFNFLYWSLNSQILIQFRYYTQDKNEGRKSLDTFSLKRKWHETNLFY